ncbi:class II aminotransferase [Streptococcus criceti]|uniref:cysteine-S-conjugate beta-lyase n=1 Tax=Streptococcus criceti HS-6 TaxID=873449 RepID=G5JTF0_STRCG|nr:MalY/PatB family protein [Streptococcus criceti]EHI73315.1 aminotransferase, class II [Streptococcus criceti HS-6]SUN43585.1 class II aminotransferase [Streptococcus criceti]
MTQYDFTTLPNRLNNHSMKWKEVEANRSLLPLWVADMDFLAFPEMKAAVQAYADRGVYGYPYFSDQVLESIQNWEREQHGYRFDKEALVLIEGVVPAISVAIQTFTKEGDAVLINTPVYPPFARSVKLNNRQLIENSLVERQGHFEIDFDQLEKDVVENQVKLYVFCSPHNPGGRVWSPEELIRVAELCRKHGVILVSDEIHQDLALFGHKHHSINTLGDFQDFTVVLSSATKTFNIAGTKNSFAIIENSALRAAFKKRQLGNNQHEVPTIGLVTTETAFRYGKPWLTELKKVLEDNINLVFETLTQKTNIKVMKPEGTYLVWLDFSDYHLSDEELHRKIKEEAKLILNVGSTFGKEGTGHARLNVATPKTTLQEALNRLVQVF